MRRVLAGEPFFSIHGALLQSAPGEGVIVFGPSGVGKSTTMNRFRSAGGVCHADDAILGCLRNGELYAYPLPTRSFCAENWHTEPRYPFAAAVKVRHLYALERGKQREAIAPIEKERFLATLLPELNTHTGWFLTLLPLEKRLEYGEKALESGILLAESFAPQALFARFGANILHTLGVTR